MVNILSITNSKSLNKVLESLSKVENNLVHVTEEFIEENKKTSNTLQKKKNGGPYTKSERQKRQDEVYRLHFEYGYSARKIADMMKISRNTISGDINYWFDKMGKKLESFLNPEEIVITHITRFELQRTRLREALDKTSVFQERLALEKLIFDIESKMMQTRVKLIDSQIRNIHDATNMANGMMEKLDHDKRFFSFLDSLFVPEKSFQKIMKILKDSKALRY